MTERELNLLLRMARINSDKIITGLTSHLVEGCTKSEAAREAGVTRATMQASVIRIEAAIKLGDEYCSVFKNK